MTAGSQVHFSNHALSFPFFFIIIIFFCKYFFFLLFQSQYNKHKSMGIWFASITGLKALQEHFDLKTISGWGVLSLEVCFLLLYFILYAYVHV